MGSTRHALEILKINYALPHSLYYALLCKQTLTFEFHIKAIVCNHAGSSVCSLFTSIHFLTANLQASFVITCFFFQKVAHLCIARDTRFHRERSGESCSSTEEHDRNVTPTPLHYISLCTSYMLMQMRSWTG